MNTRQKIETYLEMGEFLRSFGVDLKPAPPPPHIVTWLCARESGLEPGTVVKEAIYYRVHLEDEGEPEAGDFGLLLHPEIAFDLVGTGLFCKDLGAAFRPEDAESPIFYVEGQIQFASVWEGLQTWRIGRALRPAPAAS